MMVNNRAVISAISNELEGVWYDDMPHPFFALFSMTNTCKTLEYRVNPLQIKEKIVSSDWVWGYLQFDSDSLGGG